jgi:hypothetical protein
MTAARQSFSEWAKSFSETDYHWAIVPQGHMASFWLIAISKNWLQQKLPDDLRWKISKSLDDQRSEFISEEMIAMIQPARPAECELFSAAMKAGSSTSERAREAFDILMKTEMFDLLTLANPSVLDALKHRAAKAKSCAAYRYPDAPADAGNSSGSTSPPVSAGTAATYAADFDYGIPARFFTARPAPIFAIGTPNHPDGQFDLHKGR